MTSRTRGAYRRPSRPRIFCPECDDLPDGFRSEHELRRHYDRKHKPTQKAWIIVDISKTDGASSEDPPTLDPPVKPLADCRSCRSEKRYSADYNAAAHLRRVHFNPRPPRTTGKRKAESERYPRSHTGVWPSMKSLRGWMREVEDLNREVAQKEGDPAMLDAMEFYQNQQNTWVNQDLGLVASRVPQEGAPPVPRFHYEE